MTINTLAPTLSSTWFMAFGGTQFCSPYIASDLSVLVDGQPFTVVLQRVWLPTLPKESQVHHWFHGSHALVVTSRASLGGVAPTSRVHDFRLDAQPPVWFDSLLSDEIYLCEDYKGLERLWLELRVALVDPDQGWPKNITEHLQILTGSAGALFPAAIPFKPLAAGVGQAIRAMVVDTDDTRNLLCVTLSLEPAGHGNMLLRPGYYVLFADPINIAPYHLAPDASVTDDEGNLCPYPYVVVRVDTAVSAAPEFVVTQEVAALLNQMDPNSGAASEQAFDAITAITQDAVNFRKLQRYEQLRALSQPTPEQQSRLNQLSSDPALQQYLKQNGS